MVEKRKKGVSVVGVVCRMMRGQEDFYQSGWVQEGVQLGVAYYEQPCVFYFHGGNEVLLLSPDDISLELLNKPACSIIG